MFLIKEIRSKNGELHFQRYRILETPWFSIYLHYIAKSDEDKHPHNHPWNFRTVVLSGGYTEELVTFVEDAAHFRYVPLRTINHIKSLQSVYRDINQYHKITIDKPTWTLVFCGPKEYGWGYCTESLYIGHKFYRQLKNDRNVDSYLYDKVFGNGNMGSVSSNNVSGHSEASQDSTSQSV